VERILTLAKKQGYLSVRSRAKRTSHRLYQYRRWLGAVLASDFAKLENSLCRIVFAVVLGSVHERAPWSYARVGSPAPTGKARTHNQFRGAAKTFYDAPMAAGAPFCDRQEEPSSARKRGIFGSSAAFLCAACFGLQFHLWRRADAAITPALWARDLV
jgi:hypothetical protein